MIKQIKKIAIFFLILIAIVLIINSIYIKHVFSKTLVMRADSEYYEYISNSSNREIDYAFFGTSHTRGDINPDYISPKAYNFAAAAESHILLYYKLKKMLEADNITIKNAAFEIDMQTFSGNFINGGRILGYTNYAAKFMSISEIRKVKSQDSLFSILLEIYLPVLGNGEDLKLLLINDFERAEKRNKGSLLFTGDFTKVDQNISLNGAYVSHFKSGERIDELDMEYFLKTLKLAESRNISIIFIKNPVTKEYNEYMKQRNITREDYYSEIFARINATINNYTSLDYHDSFNDSSLFYDSHHLNIEGAKLFSQKLHKDLGVK